MDPVLTYGAAIIVMVLLLVFAWCWGDANGYTRRRLEELEEIEQRGKHVQDA